MTDRNELRMFQTLIKALGTEDLSEIIMHLSLAPVDIDLLLYDAQEQGIISVKNRKKSGKIKLLEQPSDIYHNEELLDKIKRTIGHYDKQEANITRSRLEQIILNLNHPSEKFGYPIHEFVCTMYYLEESGAVNFYEIKVPEIKDKRPYAEFKFYTFLDHQEFGAKAVNDFISQFEKIEVK